MTSRFGSSGVLALEREPLVESNVAIDVGVRLEQEDAAPCLVVDEQEMGHVEASSALRGAAIWAEHLDHLTERSCRHAP